jgi:hypothetical protein
MTAGPDSERFSFPALNRRGHFPGYPVPPIRKEKEMLFQKSREKLSEHVNDRIVQPVRTALLISALAFVLAAIALVYTVTRHADH